MFEDGGEHETLTTTAAPVETATAPDDGSCTVEMAPVGSSGSHCGQWATPATVSSSNSASITRSDCYRPERVPPTGTGNARSSTGVQWGSTSS